MIIIIKSQDETPPKRADKAYHKNSPKIFYAHLDPLDNFQNTYIIPPPPESLQFTRAISSKRVRLSQSQCRAAKAKKEPRARRG